MFLFDKFAIRHYLLPDKDEDGNQRKWNKYIESLRTPHTMGVSYLNSDLERSLGLCKFKGESWQKPQNLLKKYKDGVLPKIADFRKQVEQLVGTSAKR